MARAWANAWLCFQDKLLIHRALINITAKAQFAPASGDGAAGRLVGFGVGVSPLFRSPCRQEHLKLLLPAFKLAAISG